MAYIKKIISKSTNENNKKTTTTTISINKRQSNVLLLKALCHMHEKTQPISEVEIKFCVLQVAATAKAKLPQ